MRSNSKNLQDLRMTHNRMNSLEMLENMKSTKALNLVLSADNTPVEEDNSRNFMIPSFDNVMYKTTEGRV